jgi:preprotein translocase subunit SecY
MVLEMIRELQKVFQIPELRAKILFTILMLAVFRIGGFIPVPGINGEIAVNFFRHATGGGQNLFQLVDIFSGGAFSQMTVIALGVVPYISASIIMQLLVALWPSLQREIKENADQGRRKINKYTRGLTVILSFLQSAMFAKYAIQMNYSRPGIVTGELLEIQMFGMPILFYLLFIFTMTTGTVFLMWIGEQITEKGIGNGMSLIISVGIVSQLPTAIGLIFQQLNLNSQ